MQPPTSPPVVAKKGGISAVFGFLTAKDKKKEEVEDEDLDRSEDDLLGKSPTSSPPPPPPPKADSLSMQLLGKSGEPQKDVKFVQFDDQYHDSAQANEYPIDLEPQNDVEDNQNAEVIDAEDLAKHFHFSINRRQARSHISSKNAAKFMSKANREGAAGKGNNLLLQKKSHVNDVILADYTPVNEAYGVRPDDDSSQRTSRVQFPSSVNDNSKPSTHASTFAANAKKRASVIGVGGLSQIYKSNQLESKSKGTTDSLLESIMADILSQQSTAFDEQISNEYSAASANRAGHHKKRQSFDRETLSIPEDEEDEFSEQFSEMESEMSKNRSSFPSEPPPEDEEFSDAPPSDILDEIDIEEDDDDLPPPEDDEELNLSNIEDDIPLSDPGQEENQSQLRLQSRRSPKLRR